MTTATLAAMPPPIVSNRTEATDRGYPRIHAPEIERAEPRVLVIDDEGGICELLTLYLTQKGLDVSTVRTATEAKPLLNRGGFDLVILDWKLDGAEGLSLLRLSKERHPEIPVVIYTGADLSDIPLQEGRVWGADEVVRKMGPLNALCAAVFRHLAPV
jgi:DNA-binding response OmpR family regulator